MLVDLLPMLFPSASVKAKGQSLDNGPPQNQNQNKGKGKSKSKKKQNQKEKVSGPHGQVPQSWSWNQGQGGKGKGKGHQICSHCRRKGHSVDQRWWLLKQDQQGQVQIIRDKCTTLQLSQQITQLRSRQQISSGDFRPQTQTSLSATTSQ